ncbi:MAG: phenylalanine--tRNA ligase subunit beta [Candidatus Atribacteria bacterium]|nr:MAG: phenylalanine--tRNA ligase subunit beta [Candidatus Atribacteria bacterium]
MKVPCRWLTDYVTIDVTQGSVDQLARRLTLAGLEVEGIEQTGSVRGAVVGHVKTCQGVPDSDHLSLCTVDVGSQTVEIVCGAPNVAAGMTVPVVLPGGELPGGFKIEQRKIRGQVSHGMICSKAELGLEDKSEGIWEFPADLNLVIGTDLNELFEFDDFILDIKVPSNRPDCASIYGIAREVAALLDRPLAALDTSVEETLPPVTDIVHIEIEDAKDTPRYTAKLMEGIRVGASPLHMQHRLLKAGMRPLSNVVDATNYVMLELGYPLHPFDANLVNQPIVIRRASEGETFRTLDSKDHTLSSEVLMIADQQGGVALAGVMGGERSEIRPETSRVLLEIASFFGYRIRKSARSVSLRSEASQRFERDLNPETIPFVAKRATHLIQKLTGCQVHSGLADAYPAPVEAVTLRLRPQRAVALLGIDVDQKACLDILARLNLPAQAEGDAIRVLVPAHRSDLEREVDLIEDIGRVYGYDRLMSKTPSAVLRVGRKGRVERDKDLVREALVGLGMVEVITDGFDNRTWREILGQPADDLIRIANPMTQGQTALRNSLVPDLLAVIQTNLSQGVDGGMIFEWSRTFSQSGGEQETLAGALFGRTGVALRGKEMISLPLAKGILDQLFAKMNLHGVEVVPVQTPSFLHPSQSAWFEQAGSRIGFMGALDPSMIEHFAIQVPIVVFEFSGAELTQDTERTVRYEKMSQFPPSKRDLSVSAPSALPEERIREILLAEPAVHSALLYDRYQGEQIAADKTSLTYELAFRATDRTLTDEDVALAIDRISKGLLALDVHLRT